MLVIGALGAISSVFGLGTLYSHKKLKKIETKKKSMKQQIVKYEDLKDYKDSKFVLEFKTDKEIGLIDVQQKIAHTFYDYKYYDNSFWIPFIGYIYDIDWEVYEYKEHEYITHGKYLTRSDFGLDNLIQHSKFDCNTFSIKALEISDQHGEDIGSQVEAYIRNKGAHINLDRSSIYKFGYYCLKNKTLYLVGEKVNGKFMYCAASTDPDESINIAYKDKIKRFELSRYVCFVSSIIFGSISILEILSKK